MREKGLGVIRLLSLWYRRTQPWYLNCTSSISPPVQKHDIARPQIIFNYNILDYKRQ